jgi:hypothetical protein
LSKTGFEDRLKLALNPNYDHGDDFDLVQTAASLCAEPVNCHIYAIILSPVCEVDEIFQRLKTSKNKSTMQRRK